MPELIITFAIGALILLAITLFVGMRQLRIHSGADFNTLKTQFEAVAAQQNELAGRLAAFSDQTLRYQLEFSRSMNERLDQVGQRLGENLNQAAALTNQSLANLQSRLAVLDQAQGNLAQLSKQVVDLQGILDNKHRRGQFGEQILETLVQDILPVGIYELQATLSNRMRVDCLIRLPNPPGPVPIDSKFPLESYRTLLAAQTDTEQGQARRVFQAAIEKHVNDIADKYILRGETAEAALLFLPSEAIYAELHGSFPDIVEKARRRHVFIVSPATLMATLTAFRALLRDAQIREQAYEIQRYVGLLLDDVTRLLERTDNLKRHFAQADRDIRDIETSATKISRRAGQIGELEISDSQKPPSTVPNPDEPGKLRA